jgi:ribosomal protein S17E
MTRYLEIKPGSISEVAKKLKEDYQDFFKKELEKTGKSLASMTDAEKKAFYNRIDKEYNAKNEAAPAAKPNEQETTLVAKPGDKEKVIRISKDKLSDYKSKGWVEAESFVPEAATEPYAIGMAAAMKQTGDKPPLKKSTITKAHDIAKSIEKKEEVKEETLEEGGMKEIDTNKKELERLSIRLSNLRDRKNANAGGDTTDVEKQIKQTQMSVIDLKKKLSATKTEEVEITEAEGSSGGGMDALRAIKAKRQRLQGELEALNKDDPNYKEKRAAKQKEIEAQKEIMARKQREVFDSYDPSLKELEELETVEEAAGPDRLTNLNDKISKLQVNLSKLDKSKPESKTKEAIIKSDLVTAKLRLQDLMQKRNTETKKESVNEAKKNYKSMKKSLKKEQDKEVNTKRTLTDKPITKVDVDPKIKG